MLSLAKKFGTAAVEDACAAALEMGVHEYRFVRRYLERAPQLTMRQVDPLIRELVHYRDLITSEPRSQKMNLIELNRALGQLRLGGIAVVLETRLRQAQAEAMPRLTSSPAWSPTNSLVVASDCWSAEKNRPSSETLRKLSITSTSTSTER